MKDKTLKLQYVANTLKVCKNMAEANKENEKNWISQGNNILAFVCRQLASAYDFIAILLEKDLEDKD